MDAREEARYEQLRRLGQELHVPVPETFWEFEVRGRDGRVIQRLRMRSHSWVRNAYNHMFTELAAKNNDDSTFGPGLLSIKDTAGIIRYGDGAINLRENVDVVGKGYRAGAGIDTFGILVGSGTNAEDFEDYELQTQIVSGTGAGELSHVEQDAHVIAWDGGTKVLSNEMVRYFNNNSGGGIDVNEVALVLAGQPYATAGTMRWVQARDKLGATVTVPDTGQLKVSYIVQLAYPA